MEQLASDSLAVCSEVCGLHGCHKCDESVLHVPLDCPWFLIHAVNDPPLGLQDKPRRWGKTTNITNRALALAGFGYRVAVVIPWYDQWSQLRTKLRYPTKLMKFETGKFEVLCKMRVTLEGKPHVVLTDDINPKGVRLLMEEVFVGCRYDRGFYTAIRCRKGEWHGHEEREDEQGQGGKAVS